MSDNINYGESSKRLVDSIAMTDVDIGSVLFPTLTLLVVVGAFAFLAYKIASEGRWLSKFNMD